MSFAHTGAWGLFCICVARGSRKCAFSSMQCRIIRAPAFPYLRRCMPLLCTSANSRPSRHEIAALHWFATRPPVRRRVSCARAFTNLLECMFLPCSGEDSCRSRHGFAPLHVAAHVPARCASTNSRPCMSLPCGGGNSRQLCHELAPLHRLAASRPCRDALFAAVYSQIRGNVRPCYTLAEIPASCVMNLRICMSLAIHQRRSPPAAT